MDNFYVYRWTNLLDGKCYIGKGRRRRATSHRRRSQISRDCPVFYSAIRKHGLENFELTYLALGLAEGLAHDLELAAIQAYSSMAPDGYNVTAGGEGTSGLRHSQKSKEKMSKAHSGFRHSEETIKKMAESARLRSTPEYREMMSRIKKNPSNEIREKIGATHRGKIVSAETRKKQSEARLRMLAARKAAVA